jgi:hypothetical protein
MPGMRKVWLLVRTRVLTLYTYSVILARQEMPKYKPCRGDFNLL